jgi:hypothetical protein
MVDGSWPAQGAGAPSSIYEMASTRRFPLETSDMPSRRVVHPSLVRASARAALVAIAWLPLAIGAQAPRLLTKPDAEFAEPFTSVNGVRELNDGRVVVIDSRDKIVQVVDFKSGAAVKVGREGSGPGEYAFPMRLVPLPGDSSGVYDMLNSRMLVVLPNGKPGPFVTIEQPQASGPGGGMVRIGGASPRFADGRGRLYWTGPAFAPGNGDGPPKSADSVPVLRYDRGTRKTDTLAWVRVPKNNVQTSGGSGNMQVRIGVSNPFAPRDEWGVTPDGRVMVLRSPEYRVELYGPTGRTATNTIAYDRVKVTEKHKEQWRESRKQQTSMMVTVNNGQRSVRTGPPPADMPDPSDWPDVMPPFLENAVFIAPNGMLWIHRTRAANDETPNYDVLDASGKVAMKVELPKGARLVGVGNGVVYATRTDEDDLQYLQRFRVQ